VHGARGQDVPTAVMIWTVQDRCCRAGGDRRDPAARLVRAAAEGGPGAVADDNDQIHASSARRHSPYYHGTLGAPM